MNVLAIPPCLTDHSIPQWIQSVGGYYQYQRRKKRSRFINFQTNTCPHFYLLDTAYRNSIVVTGEGGGASARRTGGEAVVK